MLIKTVKEYLTPIKLANILKVWQGTAGLGKKWKGDKCHAMLPAAESVSEHHDCREQLHWNLLDAVYLSATRPVL